MINIKTVFAVISFALYAQGVVAKCTTQTIVMGDKVVVCTTCGSITNCV